MENEDSKVLEMGATLFESVSLLDSAYAEMTAEHIAVREKLATMRDYYLARTTTADRLPGHMASLLFDALFMTEPGLLCSIDPIINGTNVLASGAVSRADLTRIRGELIRAGYSISQRG